MRYKINSKENLYFSIRMVFSIAFYALVAFLIANSDKDYKGAGIILLSLIIYYAAIYLIFTGLFIGYVKGNCVKITNNQFPDAYAVLIKQCEQLGLNKMPSAYVMESGGFLNTLIAKFLGKNFIIIYSEVFELAYSQRQDALEFIIGYGLGSVRRNYISKDLFLLPSIIIPFLASAYSRAGVYTCDSIGAALSPKGAVDGLLILAAGKDLHRHVNVEEYIKEERNDSSFWKWLSEKTSSHPNLPKRISNVQQDIANK